MLYNLHPGNTHTITQHTFVRAQLLLSLNLASSPTLRMLQPSMVLCEPAQPHCACVIKAVGVL